MANRQAQRFAPTVAEIDVRVKAAPAGPKHAAPTTSDVPIVTGLARGRAASAATAATAASRPFAGRGGEHDPGFHEAADLVLLGGEVIDGDYGQECATALVTLGVTGGDATGNTYGA